MGPDEIERVEIDLVLKAIHMRYGHDFRGYTRAHLERRIRNFLLRTGYASASELIPRLLYDEGFFERFVAQFSITVTQMFRHPFAFRSIREYLVPFLCTYPFIKVWVAGCATGEEAYSLAIVFKEEGLYDRCTIFATDFNDQALEKAKEGIYELDGMRQFAENYLQAGGKRSASEYYHAAYDHAIMDQSLRENLVFANHNLATDGVFSEMQLILCRNVLIYFDNQLQDRVLSIFEASLGYGGFLCLGANEEVRFSTVGNHFRVIDYNARIFQKTVKSEQ